MKRFISFALVLVLVLAMVPAAFAATSDYDEYVRQPLGRFLASLLDDAWDTTSTLTLRGEGDIIFKIVICTGDRVRIRDDAWGNVLGYANAGDAFIALAEFTPRNPTEESNNNASNWTAIRYNGGTGYIHSSYIRSASAGTGDASPDAATGKVLEKETPLEKSATPVLTSGYDTLPITGTANPAATLTMYINASSYGDRTLDISQYMGGDGAFYMSVSEFRDNMIAAYGSLVSPIYYAAITQTEPGKTESDPVVFYDAALPSP